MHYFFLSTVWQHPHVNVFKHFDVASWKKASKQGEVVSLMDKTLKCTVFKITGSVPAGNYIQLPKTSTQSLGLTGRFLYLLFRPIPTKYFVVHMDVATIDGLVVRVSFSNMFKEFKSTSTWLQFPFICHSSKSSVHGNTASVGKDDSGPTPLSARWTLLSLDFSYILSMYLNRKYSYLKNIKLCANMLVKNIFTSDNEYEPGMTLEEVKRTGLTLNGVRPVPREMSYPLSKGEYWHDNYDLIRFPSDGTRKPFDSIQHGRSSPPMKNVNNCPLSPKRISPRTKDVSKAVSDRVTLIDKLTTPKKSPKRRVVTTATELPLVGIPKDADRDDVDVVQDALGEVHIFAHPHDDIVVHRQKNDASLVHKVDVKRESKPLKKPEKKPSYKCLKPDPILQLKRIVGFGGASCRDAVWSRDQEYIVYPCHAVIVAMNARNGYQRFLIGHTDKVSCLSFNGASTLLASGQTGHQSAVRVWNFKTRECLALFKAHVHTLSTLSISSSGNMICGVGKDGHGKNMVVVWNTTRAASHGEATVVAKAHTDVDISRIRIAQFDESRLISCGRDNIRVWRIRDGALRSAPVNLGEYHTMEFSDICYEEGFDATRDPNERLFYVCSKSGHMFSINHQKMAINEVHRLLPVTKKKKDKDRPTFHSGSGIGINSMCVTDSFCVTGSDDGFLRLWSLDFSHVYLEAEHEGPVTAVAITDDGLKILAGTITGNLGVLDVATRQYTTLMRSHMDRIHAASVDTLRRNIVTVSADHTIRVWDIDTLQQLYDFSAPQECPCAVICHPSKQVFACGFVNGIVRIFSVETTSMLAEYHQHRGKVTGLAYSPMGDFLYSAGELGTLVLYDASTDTYPLVRLLGNIVAKGDKSAPNTIAVNPNGRHIAVIGPTDFTISVLNARSLDEVMHIDISTIEPACGPSSTVIDTALQVAYSPSNVRNLLVATANKRLLKLDAATGKLLAQIDHIHRNSCSALTVSPDGRYLATSGDRLIKIWDYHMRLDINFQVFIGHSEAVSGLLFTPDAMSIISIGEAIFIWDFMANIDSQPTQPEGRQAVSTSFVRTEDITDCIPRNPVVNTKKQLDDFQTEAQELSTIARVPNGDVETASEVSVDDDDILVITPKRDSTHIRQSFEVIDAPDDNGLADAVGRDVLEDEQQEETPLQVKTKCHVKHDGAVGKTRNLADGSSHFQPHVLKHFSAREKKAPLAQKRYVALPNQAGLTMKAAIGYNGNGRSNMVWQPENGFFAYTLGCIVIVEDLASGKQKHLMGHVEEISCLALQNDCQAMASACGPQSDTPSAIFLWDLISMECTAVLSHHKTDIVCMDYSRDDRFLISVSDYRENLIVIWSTYTHQILIHTETAIAIHDIRWDPTTSNEFSCVGDDGNILFWLLEETGGEAELKVHEINVPQELIKYQHKEMKETVAFTCLEYANDNILYVGSSSGQVLAIDTRTNKIFMHWNADNYELVFLKCRCGRLITASAGHTLKMWSVVGVGEMKLPGKKHGMRQGGLLMEDEIHLDGVIVSFTFDDTLDMGIVGTSSGTLWYVNWPERSTMRLVSGHGNKVTDIAMCESPFFATCADDGSLRVWSIDDREQILQFQVQNQSCNCLAFGPKKPGPLVKSTPYNVGSPVVKHQESSKSLLPDVVAGYSDGTVRMFDLNTVELVLKMHPHSVAVTAINFSYDGRMIISGGCDGLVAISSAPTGITVRIINDHKGAPINCIDVTPNQDAFGSSPEKNLWLVSSADQRVSIWSADWLKDFCELMDWLTFPAPSFTPDGAVIKKNEKNVYQLLPPSIARFSSIDSDHIVYTGYGMQKHVQFYSLSEKKVVNKASLGHWARCMEMSSVAPIIALGENERLLKVMDYFEGSFQDYVGHSDGVHKVKFSNDGKYLFSVSMNEILVWDVLV
ncbi:WD repeat-containing protein 90-like [Tubulanus polymorphus]|uniref:WD repeat-containing protein 90-like n=1 Tax=Tubulanus polymorphus TaxID=672921 RepID=UPI003DA6A071